MGRSPRILKFLAVGLSGVGVNLGALTVLVGVFGVHRLVASALAIELSIVSNFLLNNAWTFRDRNARASARPFERWLRYNLVCLFGMGVQLTVFEGANQVVMRVIASESPGVFIYPAQLLGIAAATAWNFVSNTRWTWAQAPER